MKAINYGVVDFKTITDKRLSIHARGIYCYLACYANKNHTAFPSRERILRELGLSKNGYYKHYHQLEDNGIMLIERSQCKNNKYHLFFRKLIEKYKFGFAYKEVMTDPNISLAAKTVFVYITSYCPKGKIWYFKKSEITEELGVSAYVLNRALKELSALELIDITVSQYEISIMNMYDSSEKEGHESSNNEDITAEKGGHETPKKEDAEVKKEGHDLPTNEDREQYNSYNYNFYQSSPISHIEEDDEKDGQLKVGMSEEDIKELVDTEISTDSFKKHNYYYFIIVLTKYAENACYVKRLNDLLENKELTLSSFAYAFLQRYEFKSKDVKVKSPVKYMTTCLYEFISHYDYLKDEVRCSRSGSGYGPSYDIEKYERMSFYDDLEDF